MSYDHNATSLAATDEQAHDDPNRNGAQHGGREPPTAGVQLLSFMLAGQEFGVDILRVQEIRELARVTAVPNTAPFVLGVMNLRGAVVPLIDLRRRLGLPEQSYTPHTVVIVIHSHSEERERVMGVLVDAVAEVYDLDPAQITAPPDVSACSLAGFVSGLVTRDGRMITLLDFDRLLNVDAMLETA